MKFDIKHFTTQER